MSDVLTPIGDSAVSADARPQSCGAAAPIGVFARALLARQFRKARRLIRDFAHADAADAEDVHRLRVATRRCDAALRTLAPLAPGRRSRRLRRLLRQVRRAAGRLRDLDVLSERLHPEGDNGVYHEVQRQRGRLLKKLRRTAEDAADCKLKKHSRKCLRRVRWYGAEPEPRLEDAAPDLLRPIARNCQSAGAADLTDPRRLHRFRVNVKRLRYACEFLEAGMSPRVAHNAIALLTDLQQRLGVVCDHSSAIELLNRHLERGGAERDFPRLAPLIQAERELLETRQSECIRWWESRGRSMLDGAIDECLAGAAGSH